MRQALLVSVAALALAAGSTLALSQGSGQSGGAGGAGTMSKDSQSTMESAPGAKKGAQERTAPAQKSTQQQQPAQKSTQQQPPAQPGAQERTAPAQKSTQQPPTQPGAQQRQTESPQPGAKQGAQTGGTGGTKQGASQGSMASSNVALTTEQKTTIRNTVISSGPKVTNVDFDVRVGTVVPRTVKFAPVPLTLIKIRPAWRGYRYFVYADEIIIVDPRTFRIVAVLEV